MKWNKVGNWIKENASGGAGLVGSLLTGGVPGAIAAGISIVSGATGTDDPEKVLQSLKDSPVSMVKLKELYVKEEDNVRRHLKEMKQLELEDEQHEHLVTQETIRQADKSEHGFVRNTRPMMAWCFTIASIAYVFMGGSVDVMILGMFMSYPLSYAGMRQIGKGMDTVKGDKAVLVNTAINLLKGKGK